MLTVQKSSASWRWPSGCFLGGVRLGLECQSLPSASHGGVPAPAWCGCKECFWCWRKPSLTAHSLSRKDELRQDTKLLTLLRIVIRHPSTDWASGRSISISPKERDITPSFISKKFVESLSHLVIHVEFWTWVTVLKVITKLSTDWVSWSRETDRFVHICNNIIPEGTLDRHKTNHWSMDISSNYSMLGSFSEETWTWER